MTALAIGGASYWYFTKEDEGVRTDRETAAIDQIRRTAGQVLSSFEEQQFEDRAWSYGRSDGASGAPGGAEARKSPDRAATLEAFEKRYRQLEQSKPATPSELEARAVALAEISAACAEFLSRGAVESYGLQAAVDVDMGMFREVATHLGLEGSVPANHYELLPPEKLAELETLQVRKITAIQERQAVSAGLYTAAVEHELQVLKQIQAAKAKPTFDPVAFFTAAVRGKKLPPAVLALLNSDSVRAAAVLTREAQLIAAAAARDHTDVALHLRYWQLRQSLPPESLAQLAEVDARVAILHQIRSTLPGDPQGLRNTLRQLAKDPATVEEAAALYSRARFSDPIRAAELVVLLKDAYTTATGKPVNPTTVGDFQRWVAGHLTRGELYEIATFWLRPTIELLADAATLNPSANGSDRRSVDGLHEQFMAELRDRPRNAAPGEVRLQRTVVRPPPESRKVYFELQVMAELAPRNVVISTAARARALDGYFEQLDRIDGVRSEVELANKENAKAIEDLRFIGGFEASPKGPVDAYEILANAYNSIELALLQILREEPGVARAESARLRARVGLAAIPPPLPNTMGVRSAQPFDDPLIARQLREVSNSHLSAVRASTARAVSAHTRIVDERRRTEEAARRRSQTRVEVFGRMTCSRTTQVLELYRDEGLSPVFRDVDNDVSAGSEVRRATLRGNLLPLVKVNGVSINGSGEALTVESLLRPCR